jgi:adenine-specific DNA-methyltransferase
MRDELTERQLAAIAVALGAPAVAGWSSAEDRLLRNLPPVPPDTIHEFRRRLAQGADPLGDAFCRVRTAEVRRRQGATYTPAAIVDAMLAWAASRPSAPRRIIDPGVGSGRFLVAAGRRFADAALIGVDVDPLAAMLARAHVAAAGMSQRTEIVLGDYRSLDMPRIHGCTLYLGNPPYVRHHLIEPAWKAWLTRAAEDIGLRASQLAGLHVHFFLATALKVRSGDIGAFITSSEWLDVNYGRLLRQLLTGPLCSQSVTLIEPTARPFPDAATTGAIATFEVGSRTRSVKLRRVHSVAQLNERPLDRGRLVRRERLARAHRWTPLIRGARQFREGFVELGELCRVHRGQATGSNKMWIAGPHAAGLPASVLFACVTRARELLMAGRTLADPEPLRRVIDLPADLDGFAAGDRARIEALLARAKAMGIDQGYIAKHRKAWWSVGLRDAAPILMTYMARRAPAFVRNLAGARHLNIAHGIYPRERLSGAALDALAAFLSQTVTQAEGRTYAGGLTKFEPKEVERLLVPYPVRAGDECTADPSAVSQLPIAY